MKKKTAKKRASKKSAALRKPEKSKTVLAELKYQLKIEAALEKVRARTTAMKKSEELAEIVSVLFKQLLGLGLTLNQLRTCGIATFHSSEPKGEIWITDIKGGKKSSSFSAPFNEAPAYKAIYRKWKKGEDFLGLNLKGKDFLEHLKFVKKYSSIPDINLQEIKKKYKEIFFHVLYFSQGYLFIITYEQLTEYHDLFNRFGKVFQQTYTRFLDLRRAEAQAREAQIEAALERVRSRTMAMHKSDELNEVAFDFFNQLHPLGIAKWGFALWLADEPNQRFEVWFSTPTDRVLPEPYLVPIKGHPVINKIWTAYEYKSAHCNIELANQEKREWDLWLFENSGMKNLPQAVKDSILSHPYVQFSFTSMRYGLIDAIDVNRIPDAELLVLQRFAKVYEQTYTRFLDLQKAEAQAREAQIEAALERVRTQTMAMHSSEDVGKCVIKMFGELTALGVDEGTRFGIGILNHDNENNQLWTATKEGDEVKMHIGNLDMTSHPLLKSARKAWKAQVPLHEYILEGEDLLSYYQMLSNAPDYKIHISTDKLPEREFHYGFIFEQGFFYAFSRSEFEPELIHITQRFSLLFSQTYRRYLDLKKAEAQAREAQIEAALERVRSRTMAMHQSEELSETAAVLFEQLQILGNTPERINLGIFQEESGLIEWWITTQEGFQIKKNFITKFDDHPVLERMISAWNANEKSNVVSLSGKAVTEWVQYITQFLGMPVNPKLVKEKRFLTSAFFSQGLIGTTTSEPLPVETIHLLERFAKVFEQTYTRFLDLQKAEAQAREAQVEAALERVRAKAMAMHSSQDLADTIGTFYKQLEIFNLVPRRCGVGLLNKHNKEGEVYTWNTVERGESLQLVGKIRMEGHPVLENVYKNWITKTDYHPVLRGIEIKEYNEVIRPQMAFPEHHNDEVQYGYFFMFDEGGVYAWKEIPLQEDERIIYKRFTSVLSLTYKRYKDLIDAEARALEAKRQASLDRVRGEIASMRSTEDLQRINPLVWQELTAMEIPFTRCGVFIMDESEGLIHAYLSAPGGRSLGVLHLPFKSTQFTADAIDHWRKQKMYLTHWNQDQFVQNMKTMIEQGQIEETATYQGSDKPPESLHLHFINFKQGMLYVGNDAPLNQDAIESVKTLADSFSVAYARYEDFKKLEEAKSQVEKTLSDLKAAQSQLIQSEKMASLGELTAGIAHEIQNPLNFVNNFSEVSNELLVEMKEEIEKGNVEEVKAIAEDVIANLEKILHHGRRADGIVKGMLQHSRSSSGVKEPTDINVLADEYLRLAYHGLRAKDKSFNAQFETDFDKGIGKVNVIAQDIGRVILNLITNAFYVVAEKSKKHTDGYKPLVMVSTRKKGLNIEISIKDNGNGIPESIKDKIFQPFFTTKPTGQGTGLGLSLSYDIVKTHGGELKVESKEGEGSTFIISLPFV